MHRCVDRLEPDLRCFFKQGELGLGRELGVVQDNLSAVSGFEADSDRGKQIDGGKLWGSGHRTNGHDQDLVVIADFELVEQVFDGFDWIVFGDHQWIDDDKGELALINAL